MEQEEQVTKPKRKRLSKLESFFLENTPQQRYGILWRVFVSSIALLEIFCWFVLPAWMETYFCCVVEPTPSGSRRHGPAFLKHFTGKHAKSASDSQKQLCAVSSCIPHASSTAVSMTRDKDSFVRELALSECCARVSRARHVVGFLFCAVSFVDSIVRAREHAKKHYKQSNNYSKPTGILEESPKMKMTNSTEEQPQKATSKWHRCKVPLIMLFLILSRSTLLPMRFWNDLSLAFSFLFRIQQPWPSGAAPYNHYSYLYYSWNATAQAMHNSMETLRLHQITLIKRRLFLLFLKHPLQFWANYQLVRTLFLTMSYASALLGEIGKIKMTLESLLYTYRERQQARHALHTMNLLFDRLTEQQRRQRSAKVIQRSFRGKKKKKQMEKSETTLSTCLSTDAGSDMKKPSLAMDVYDSTSHAAPGNQASGGNLDETTVRIHRRADPLRLSSLSVVSEGERDAADPAFASVAIALHHKLELDAMEAREGQETIPSILETKRENVPLDYDNSDSTHKDNNDELIYELQKRMAQLENFLESLDESNNTDDDSTVLTDVRIHPAERRAQRASMLAEFCQMGEEAQIKLREMTVAEHHLQLRLLQLRVTITRVDKATAYAATKIQAAARRFLCRVRYLALQTRRCRLSFRKRPSYVPRRSSSFGMQPMGDPTTHPSHNRHMRLRRSLSKQLSSLSNVPINLPKIKPINNNHPDSTLPLHFHEQHPLYHMAAKHFSKGITIKEPLLRPNTRGALLWKTIVLLCVGLEVVKLAATPHFLGTLEHATHAEVLERLLLPSGIHCQETEGKSTLRRFVPHFGNKTECDSKCCIPTSTTWWKRIRVSLLAWFISKFDKFVAVVSFVDVFVTFHEGVFCQRTGELVPKPFFSRWIFPGVGWQLLLNPTMTYVVLVLQQVAKGVLDVGPDRVLRWLLVMPRLKIHPRHTCET